MENKNSAKAIVKLCNIKKIYGKTGQHVEAIVNVNLEVREKEMIAIMGESGSGKSTLLNIIGLLDKQTEGEYYLLEKNTNQYTEKQKAKLRNGLFGFVMQDFALVDQYSVYDNIEIPLLYSSKAKKINRNDKDKKIKSILFQLGIEEKIFEKCCNLSGGQRQRVSIARALVNDSKVIIADEPTGALDVKTADEIMELLKNINKEYGVTIIIVTHDPRIAKSCDKIYRMDNGQLKN